MVRWLGATTYSDHAGPGDTASRDNSGASLHTAIRQGRRPTQPAEAMAARLAAFDASLLAMLDG